MLTNPYALLVLTSGLICAALAIYVWGRRPRRGAAEMTLLLAAMSIYAVGYALELLSNDLAAMRFWLRVEYVGIAPLPALWLRFVFQYTDRPAWTTPRSALLLFAIPLLTFILHQTNELHHLYYRILAVDASGEFPRVAITPGPWYWVSTAYLFLCLGLGVILIGQMVRNVGEPYRTQALAVLAGSLAPMVAFVVYLLDLPPFTHWDLTPFAFTVTGAVIAWAVFSRRLFDLTPAAYSLVFARTRAGVIVFDNLGRIQEVNPAAAAFLGQPTAQTVGRRLAEVAGRWPELCAWACQVTPPAAADVVDAHSGRVFTAELASLTAGKGGEIGRALFLHDITEREQAERALQEVNQRLQQEIHERERLIVDLQNFAHTVAHDLKAPLTIIAGYGDLLADAASELPEWANEYVQTIRRTTQKMTRIVEELLVLATIGQQDFETYPLDMAAIVAEAESRLERQIAAAAATLVHPPRWPQARGHAPWVEEVWANLIANAIQYGGRPPHIELGADEEWAGQVRFWVRDNGNGIKPELQERLFQDGARLAPTRARGHGLGLAIVRRIVERLGGTVGVESPGIPGQGSRFWFTLPPAA